MKKQLFLTLVVALGCLLIMTLVINDFIYGEPVESTTGSITREVWTGISGYSVSSIPLGAAPNITDTWPSFEAPTNWADNYGTRMRGYITAPATGNYTFWIAGDDNSELWLSLNDNPANMVRIGLVSGWTNSRQWDKYSTQKSAAINLTQGQRYYAEALQKESVLGDNLAVGWAKPGESTSAPSEVIPGSVLSPFSGGGSATTLSDKPSGQFGFPHPNFTGASGAMTAQQFVTMFDAAMHNPDVYLQWINSGTDIRKLNPNGVYAKHLSLRTLDKSYASVGDHPDYNWIHANHPEWILHDANGKTVSLGGPSEESLDFGNPAYLDWVFGTWFPNNYLDSTDRDPNLVTWYVLDNGNFLRMYSNCAVDDAVCQRYNTDAGVQTAFKTLFDKFHHYYPNKRILVSTGTLSYMTAEQQLPWLQDVLSHADGFFCECLINDQCYWNSQPNDGKRNALKAMLQLADWLASNGKYFFPNIGMGGDGTQPTQAQVNFGFAFFNLLRSGNKQFFSIVTQDSNGMWQPKSYPEQNVPLGQALETRQQVAPNVYRRTFSQAIAYVNLSDTQVSINLPAGTTYKNSLGQTVNSPLTLSSFSGLTVYGSTSQPSH